MREPSASGIRGLKSYGCLFALLVLALFGANPAGAQAITRFARDTGNINFVTTGGSLRNSPNTGTPCTLNATSAQNLTGIPAGRTIRNAYLYWGGSGTTNDTSVTLNGSAVTATRTFTRTFNNGTAYQFFGDFADVTGIVTAAGGNANYTFGNLTVNTGAPWCGSQAVVGGWALIVIYEGAAERLRAINIFDGLDSFYGSQVTQTPDGFRVPAANIDGRVAVFTLEGDPQNSDTLNGFSEALRFNGTLLDDGLVPTGSVPTVQQFDGTISTQGSLTSYGIDVDQYDVSALLSPGQTSATTVYSAGADLVLLMAQVVSATSDPAVDLGITKTHSGTFIAGATGQYTITVSNAAGFEREDNTVTVTDTLPTGLTFASGTGTGWTCAAVAQVVTCTHAPILNAGASFPPITLTVNVLQAAAASVTNTVTVSSPSFDANPANNTATDVTATLDPALTNSTKTVVDINGGEASPGDTLRYTVTFIESAGAQAVNVSMTDSVPANSTFGGFVSIPAGATSSFAAAPAGANNNGLLTVTGITVPASGSVAVVFDVIVPAAATPGVTINNTATITNPNGPGATPAAPQVVVNPSLIPATGQKFVYLHRSAGGVRSLSRVVPTAADTNETLTAGQSTTWVITPALQKIFTVSAGGIPVRLWLTRDATATNRTVTVTLTSSSGFSATSGAVVLATVPTGTTPTLFTFTIPNAAGFTLPVGATITLTVANSGANSVLVYPNGPNTAGNNSRLELNSTTVINVDSVQTFNATFNGGAVQATFYPGTNVFVRATVSDPFGSFDIGSARITITDPANVIQVNNLLMTAQGAPATCNSAAAATCVLQYQYTVPGSPTLGTWNVRVTANEGTEGTVSDFGLASFAVAIPQPSITLLKTSTVLSDPVNASNPKRIPLAVVQYDITVTNSGPGTVDSNTLVITDPLPATTTLYVATTSGDPVVFVNGATPSGLTYTYATNVTYSSVGVSGPWTYVPVPDANGFDAAVRAVRISPAGIMSAAGSGNPSFAIRFRVRVN
jgi:trimeric autotransporter adhesin